MVAFMTEQYRDRIMSPHEVGRMLGVDVKTVSRYARNGKLPEGFLTPGGHRRWYESEILARVPGVRPGA